MTRAIKRKVYWTVAVVFIGMVASVFLVGWYASEKVIHPYLDVSPYNPSQFDLPLESVHFLSRDGFKLAGWFIPGNNGATVILAHGRNSERSRMLPNANYLYNEGFSVLLFDFRYRGESEGDAQTLGAKEAWDIQSAVDYLKNRSDIDPGLIGVQGNSMGAVSAILAAAETPEIKGVVAEIPFTSLNDILSHTFPLVVGLPSFPFAPATKFICGLRTGVDFDDVAPVEAIVRISPRPIFLIDDSEDQLFPCDSVETLYRTAKEPKALWQIPGAAHGKGWESAPKEYERRVLAFWVHTFGIGPSEKSRDKNVED